MIEPSAFHLTILPEMQKQFGPCDCCGKCTERVWGFVERGDETVASYYVEWTPDHLDRAANFDLIVGQWGESADTSTRQSVAMEFRHLETGPAFKVIDAGERPYASNPLVFSAMSREEVLGGDMRELVFSLVDTIYFDDPRIEPLRTPTVM